MKKIITLLTCLMFCLVIMAMPDKPKNPNKDKGKMKPKKDAPTKPWATQKTNHKTKKK